MKILMILGSPRKKDTWQAFKKFEQKFKQYEEAEFEYVSLMKYQLRDCLGCHNCVSLGDEYCPERGKIQELLTKLIEADGVVLGTPIYSEQVSYLMKKFLDYLAFLYHRPRLFDTVFMGIVTGSPMAKNILNYLKKCTIAWGGIWAGGFSSPHYEALTPKFQKKNDQSMQKMALRFHSLLVAPSRVKPSFSRIMWFNIWKLNVLATKDYCTKDFTYWTEKQWLTSSFYYSVQINPLTRFFSQIAFRIAKNFMGKAFNDYKDVKIPKII